MDPVPRGALTNRAARQSIPLLCGRVGRFLIGADLKGECDLREGHAEGFGFVLLSLWSSTTVA